ncbi:MAG: MFS transporter [Deltaproteobacteria bacterium]|nr:MAG: MFS transporter [Deltaproteobacteria bacterium]
MDMRLAAILIGVILFTVDSSALNLVLPSLAAEFHTDAAEVQGVVSLYLVGASLAFLPLSGLAGKFGTLKVYRISLFCFSVISLFLVIAPNLSTLIALRFIQGVASAGIVGLVFALVSASFPEKKGWALGMVAGAAAAGTLIGPPLGGFMVDTFGWRSIFCVNLPFGLLALFLSRKLCDLSGVGFIKSLSRVIVAPRFLLSLLATFFHYVHMFGTYLLWPFYLEAEGMTPSQVGLFLLLPSAMLLFVGPWAGNLSDKKGFDKISFLGSIVLAISSCLQGITGRVTLGLAGIGFGRALFQGANNAAVLSDAPEKTETVASGVISIARVSGQALGSVIAGGLWAAFEYRGDDYAFLISNMVLGGFAILSGVLIVVRKYLF